MQMLPDLPSSCVAMRRFAHADTISTDAASGLAQKHGQDNVCTWLIDSHSLSYCVMNWRASIMRTHKHFFLLNLAVQ